MSGLEELKKAFDEKLIRRIEKLETALEQIDQSVWSVDALPIDIIRHFKKIAKEALEEDEK